MEVNAFTQRYCCRGAGRPTPWGSTLGCIIFRTTTASASEMRFGRLSKLTTTSCYFWKQRSQTRCNFITVWGMMSYAPRQQSPRPWDPRRGLDWYHGNSWRGPFSNQRASAGQTWLAVRLFLANNERLSLGRTYRLQRWTTYQTCSRF